MFALTIDQRRSRRGDDLVPELLGLLGGVRTVLPFERTVGDEVQGLPADGRAALDALLIVLRDGRWSAGLGIGAVEHPLPASVRAARGPALLDARDAVERAKGAGPVRVSVVSSSAPDLAAEVEALIGLIGTMVLRRTSTQWAVVDAVDASATQRAAAETLGVTPQNVSQTLTASAIGVERAGYPVLVRLLEEADAS